MIADDVYFDAYVDEEVAAMREEESTPAPAPEQDTQQ